MNTLATARSDVPYFFNMIRITETIPGTDNQYIYWLFLLKRYTWEGIPIRLETLFVGPQTHVHGPTVYFQLPLSTSVLPSFSHGGYYPEIQSIYIGDNPEESAKNNRTDHTYIELRDMVKKVLKQTECNSKEEVEN
jgi:hypothetical protein